MITVDDELAFIEQQLQENCNRPEFLLNNGDYAPFPFELGVQDDIKVELTELLNNPDADVEFYVRYDIMFPAPPVPGEGSLNSQPDINIPLVDGFIAVSYTHLTLPTICSV